MKGILVFCVMAVSFAAQAANTWFVDDDNYGKSGLDGTTEAKAYGTIQDAINAATTEDGDTIKVLPGTYDQGVKTNSLIRARVCFSKKLDIVATGTKSETHIVGHQTFGEPGDDGIGNGTNAVRCVYVASTGVGSTLTGFTLRDGATLTGVKADSNRYNVNYGGGAIGVYGAKKKTDASVNFYAVDCIISNNVCWYCSAAAFGGTLYRCQIINNRSGSNFSTLSFGSALFSVFARNVSCYAGLGGSSYLVQSATLLNCTIADNKHVQNGPSYNCLFSQNQDYASEQCTGTYSSLTTTNEYFALMAPLLGDYRPRAGTKAKDYGETKYLTTEAKVVLPDGMELRDLAGELVDTSSDRITVGAYQTPVTPAYGGLMLPPGTSVNGVTPFLTTVTNLVFPTVWPVQYCVTGKGAAGNRLVASADAADQPAIRHYPDDEERYFLTPPFVAGVVQTNVYQSTYYRKTVDSGDTAALQTFLSTKYSAGVTVSVPAGDYGGATNSIAHRGVTNCLYRVGAYFYMLVAEDGPEKTVIRGRAAANERNASAYPGCGPDAVRCIDHYYSSDFASTLCLKGFTIADGRTDCDQSTDNDCGGAAYGRSYDNGKQRQTSLYFVDCVFTNCWAPDAGVGFAATFVRCKFIDCGSAGVGFINCNLSSCVFENCDFKGGTFGANCVTVNCSDSSGNAVGDGDGQVHVNSHFGFGTTLPMSAKNLGCSLWGTFADAANGDLRPTSGSSAVIASRRPFPDEASDDFAAFSSAYAAYASSDINGNGWLFGGDYPIAGACQDWVRGVSLEAENPSAYTVVTSGETVTIGRKADAVRHYGVILAGVTNMLDDGSVTFTLPTEAKMTDGAVFGCLDQNWYVNANTDSAKGVVGSDANTGFTAATSKLTLKGVLSVATNAGDIVHAATGVYNRETMGSLDDAPTIPIRAVVADDVTLVGAGADSTFLVGEKTGDAAPVRGVYLGARARLVDFTVCGCASTNVNGAAIIASKNGELVADCVISNNIAFGAAGTLSVNSVVRSRFYGNASNRAEGDALGSCGQRGRFFNCLFDRNSGDSWLYNDIQTYNCTFGKVNSGKYQRRGSSYNVLTYRVPREEVSMYSCYGSVSTTREIYPDDKTVFTNEAALAYVDQTSYTPVIGENISIGMAELSYYTNAYPKARDPKGEAGMWLDLLGNPRVSNGTMDVGAVEADYRPLYAKIIGQRRCCVTNASPTVVLGSGKTSVLLPPASALAAVWTGRSGNSRQYQLNFRVNGSGALTVTVNGETRSYTSASGTVTWDFTSTLAENDVSFAYEGEDGAAEILQGHTWTGMLLLVR